MDLINDPLMKTVIIPVVYKDGRFKLSDDRDLPKIKEGAVGYLEMSEFSVLDHELLNELQAESDVQMLPAEENVYFGVSHNMVPSNLRNKLLTPEKLKIISNYRFIEVKLLEPLTLHLRGSKTPQLLDCKCLIPSLRNIEARSMNHAFTLISRHYEKKRRSHSGNVFQRGYYYDGKRWLSFDKLRIRCQVQKKSKKDDCDLI